MRKNGFTLIELLAVIVILAIIALIATPIILGIINDAREKANERSVELYASAVRNGIAAYQLTGLNTPKSFSDLTIQYDGDVVCTTQELYEDGSFYLEGCKVNGSEKEYSYGTKQGSSRGTVKLSDVCTPSEEQKYATSALEAGYRYECKVDPNKPAYTFYVLTSVENDAESINLIMDSNIRTGGETVKEEKPTEKQKGFVAWINNDVYISLGGDDLSDDNGACENGGHCTLAIFGPITAMNYLQTATVGWTNTNELIINTFTDRQGNTYPMAKTYTVNARMPYYGEVQQYNGKNMYLYNYLLYDEEDGIAPNAVDGVGGYWTLSPNTYNSYYVNAVYLNGSKGVPFDADTDDHIGVRPVINLSI